VPSLVHARTADEWYNEGVDLDMDEKYAEAINSFDEALKINPQFAEAWYNKGKALVSLNGVREAEALKAFDEALKINPK